MLQVEVKKKSLALETFCQDHTGFDTNFLRARHFSDCRRKSISVCLFHFLKLEQNAEPTFRSRSIFCILEYECCDFCRCMIHRQEWLFSWKSYTWLTPSKCATKTTNTEKFQWIFSTLSTNKSSNWFPFQRERTKEPNQQTKQSNK